MEDRELILLVPLFTESALENVAVGCLGMSLTEMTNMRRDNPQNTEGFNKELLAKIRNKTGSSRQVIYQSVESADNSG